MPFDRSRYPANWKAFSREIRQMRAKDRCECRGECGLHQGHEGGAFGTPRRRRRCVEENRQLAVYAKGRVVLTVAHLCSCDPPCAKRNHVKAMCNRCHLRTDIALHVRHARETRARKRAESNHDLFADQKERA